MNMRLLGAQTLGDIKPEMVDASAVGMHSSSVPGDRMFDQNCEFAGALPFFRVGCGASGEVCR